MILHKLQLFYIFLHILSMHIKPYNWLYQLILKTTLLKIQLLLQLKKMLYLKSTSFNITLSKNTITMINYILDLNMKLLILTQIYFHLLELSMKIIKSYINKNTFIQKLPYLFGNLYQITQKAQYSNLLFSIQTILKHPKLILNYY